VSHPSAASLSTRSHLPPRLGARRLAPLGALLGVLLGASAFAAPPVPELRGPPPPRVQIALLLDNSGSMSGLLNQARTQLWRVVNEFATAKQHGRPIRLELALYEYGETIRRLSPFTSNLDAVSEQLFGLGIRGGDEHCGAVIDTAVRELEWSGNPDDLKLIYIAGNEPFTQGPVSPERALASASKKGISVNVIHCGGDEPTWRGGAAIARTPFLSIDHNAQVATVNAPQDAELARLGGELNKTYLAYGARGGAAVLRQAKMDDATARAAPAAAAERAVAKSSRNYRNEEWDLVDGLSSGTVKLETLKEEELPQELKGLDASQRSAFVKQKEQQRAALQQQISQLTEARKQHLAQEQKKAPLGASTLDRAMTDSVHREAARVRDFSF
jgi:hypothetical protein